MLPLIMYSLATIRDRTIIHDFSAKVKAGQKIAIVGPTGAGKTTIVQSVDEIL